MCIQSKYILEHDNAERSKDGVQKKQSRLERWEGPRAD
jgi:hypothetical protein